MLQEFVDAAPVTDMDLRAYARVGDLAIAVGDRDPVEYWKSSPFLFNFMENYKLKRRFEDALDSQALPEGETLIPGPGLLDWRTVSKYEALDPQNGRLRWLTEDLDRHRAFEVAWLPPSLRYYSTGSLYEDPAVRSFTKRLVFSGWSVVPKVVASLLSFESERRLFSEVRTHRYEANASVRGSGRLDFRRNEQRKPGTMNTFALSWPSATLAELGDPRPQGIDVPDISTLRETVANKLAPLVAELAGTQPDETRADLRWYWAAPLLLDASRHPEMVDGWFGLTGSESAWSEGESPEVFKEHAQLAWEMVCGDSEPLGRPPADIVDVLTDMAIGSPAVCALRGLSSVSGLSLTHSVTLSAAATAATALRLFFNEAEVNALIVGSARVQREESSDERERYWLEVVRHAIDGNLQAVLDEHLHVLRDWIGFVALDDANREAAVSALAEKLAGSLGLRASSYKVDIPRMAHGNAPDRSMRTRFAVPFGQQASEEKAVARSESVSDSFNSPFWPFVLISTSIGQEGLDFHLWSHAVVHWNLPPNPVDLEQREGRVHRFKGHAVRRNLASSLDASWAPTAGLDVWEGIFLWGVQARKPGESDLAPYWVYPNGPARIERHIPLPPFSRDAAALPRLRQALAAYRLAFGQPRQDDLVEFLSAHHTADEIVTLLGELRIDLSPQIRQTSSAKWADRSGALTT